jgi:hypothetical protein
VIYKSEDALDGLLYRFRPDRWGDLSSGRLEAVAFDPQGAVSWVPVLDPGAERGPARSSAPGATVLPGCEGVAVDGDALIVTTKYDNLIRRIDLVTNRVSILWDGREPLRGVDNLCLHPVHRTLFVCEDDGNMELVSLTRDGTAEVFLRFVGHEGSEITGAAFDPSGGRLVLSSQRAPTPTVLEDLFPGAGDRRPIGRTYLVTGPF